MPVRRPDSATVRERPNERRRSRRPLRSSAKPTLSVHFAKLRDAGLVTVERQGTSLIYHLNMSILEEALSGFLQFKDHNAMIEFSPPFRLVLLARLRSDGHPCRVHDGARRHHLCPSTGACGGIDGFMPRDFALLMPLVVVAAVWAIVIAVTRLSKPESRQAAALRTERRAHGDSPRSCSPSPIATVLIGLPARQSTCCRSLSWGCAFCCSPWATPCRSPVPTASLAFVSPRRSTSRQLAGHPSPHRTADDR